MGNACLRPCSEIVTEFYFPRGYGPFPWDVKDWRVGDFDRLGEILSQYYTMQRGRGGRMSPMNWAGGGGMMAPPEFGGAPPWMGGGYMSPWMMSPENFGGGGGGGGGRRRHRSDYERMQDYVDERLRKMYEEYTKNMQERDAFLFGSDAERRQEQYKQRMLKTLQEMMPQLGQLFNMGQMGGLGPGTGMGMEGMNPMAARQQQQQAAAMAQMGMGAMGGAAGMGGFGGMGPGMNPMAAAQMGGSPMGAMSPMAGGGMDPRMMGMNDFGGGMRGSGGRRNRRLGGLGGGFRGFDDDDEGFGGRGFGGGRRRGARRGRRFGGEDSDDEDDFIGGGLHGPRFPKGPPPGPRPGRGPDRGDNAFFGGDGGGAGQAFDEDLYTTNRPLRPPAGDRPFIGRQDMPSAGPTPGPDFGASRTHFVASPPMPHGGRPGRPGSVAADDTPIPGAFAPGPNLYGGDPRRPFADEFDVGGRPSMGSPLGMSGALGGGMRSQGVRPDGPPRTVSFGPAGGPEAKLSYSRSVEEGRGEAEAGGMAGPREIK